MIYKASYRWYLVQVLPALPLVIIAVLLYLNDEASWLVMSAVGLFASYLAFLCYQIVSRWNKPMISTDDKGMQVSIYGSRERYFQWDQISALSEGHSCLKLTVKGEKQKIPINSLSPSDRADLLDEASSRTNLNISE